MYENGTKSETALARAVHILTLGAFAWEEKSPSCVSWTDLGGGDIGVRQCYGNIILSGLNFLHSVLFLFLCSIRACFITNIILG